jgi:hypothetical protein
METEDPLPQSQVPATCPYPQPARSSPYLHIPLPEDPSTKYQFRSETYSLTVSLLVCFYGEELLEPRPIPELEDHPLSAVRDRLFNIFAATLYIGGRSSIRNLRTRHAAVTGIRLPRNIKFILLKKTSRISILS